MLRTRSIWVAGTALSLLAGAQPARSQDSAPDIVEQISDEPLPADGGADVVEVIADSSSPAAASPYVPPPPVHASTPSADRLELHGWARQSLELFFADDVRRAAEPDPFALPHDQLIARTQLMLRARYSHDHWFEANVSGALGYALLQQGPARSGETFTAFNAQASRGVVDALLHELYVGLFSSRADLRLGQQRIAWGRSEFMSPNDVLNARDGRDPLVGESELRSLPTLLARGDLDLTFATLQAVFGPSFVPDRFDAFGSNWAGVQPGLPRELRGLINLLDGALDPSLREPLQRLFQGTKLPAANFSEPTFGARLAWSAGGVDVSHYYHYGFDGPRVRMDPRVMAALAATDFSQAGLASLEPLLAMLDAGESPIVIDYVRRHHIGLDVATTAGPFALRLDMAYQSQRSFFQRDLSSVVTPTVQAVVALEYQSGEPDRVILLEAMYMRALDTLTMPLLIWSRNSIGAAALVRWPLWGALGLELRALLGIRPLTQVLQPQLYYKHDNWVFTLAGLWLGGEPYSFGHYFQRNRELYAKVKVSF